MRFRPIVYMACSIDYFISLIACVFTFQDGIEIYLECGSSTSAKCDLVQRMTSVILDWITWPFKSLKSVTVSSYEYLADKTAKRIALQLRRLKDKFEGSIYSYLKPKLDNPITVIEAVLEVIWTAVRPLLRTLQLLCDFIAVVIKQAKVGNKLRFLYASPYYLKCAYNYWRFQKEKNDYIAWPICN